MQKAKKVGLIESMVLQEKAKKIVNDLNRDDRKNYRNYGRRHVLKGNILICITK